MSNHTAAFSEIWCRANQARSPGVFRICDHAGISVLHSLILTFSKTGDNAPPLIFRFAPIKKAPCKQHGAYSVFRVTCISSFRRALQ